MLFSGRSSADGIDTTADIRQPADDGHSADDGGAARYGNSTDDCGAAARYDGAARHGVANASSAAAADGNQPAGHDADPWIRRQCRPVESSELHSCGCPVAAGHIYRTVGGERGRSTTRCRTAGYTTAAAANYLVRSVQLRFDCVHSWLSANLVDNPQPCVQIQV